MDTNNELTAQAEQLRQWAAEQCGLSHSMDIRPFCTLVHVFEQSGRRLNCKTNKGINIISVDGIHNSLYDQSFLQVLSMGKDINNSLLSKAKSSYESMCLEENTEELDLLAELARSTKAPQRTAVPSPNQDRRPFLYLLDSSVEDYYATAARLQEEQSAIYNDSEDELELAAMANF